MPRLMGIDIPDNKRIEISLRYIHGIGPARSKQILEQTKIDAGKRASTLTADEIRAIIALAVTVVRAIARACPAVVSARVRMPAPARAASARSVRFATRSSARP